MSSISEEIKQRLDIATVVSEYVQLSKAGRNLRGLCPFHTEKTPSFFVFPERQTWRCFGCGAGGDIISFVMKKEGVEFGEALKALAQRAGVTLTERRARIPADERLSILYQINESAAQYYHEVLLRSPEAQAARNYLENRGLTGQTIEEFRLGFSLNEWGSLKEHLKKQGYSETDIGSAGLLSEKENRTYDRFRGRLMYPICNVKGQVVGFGARALDDSMPKYLNSAESPIFKKSDILYAIDRAKAAIREQGRVVIVEGYMDVLTSHQHGFRNVVATMGTALTENQIAVLKGLASHICLSLDADAAGNAATLRGIEVCRNALRENVQGVKGWLGKSTALGTDINILSLPEGKDPDDVIRDDPAQWQNLIDTSQPLMDYLFVATAKDFDLSRPEGRSELADRLLPSLAEMPDSAVREHYLLKLAKLTGLGERTLAAKLADRIYVKGTKKSKIKSVQASRSTRQLGDQLEEHCLCLLLQYPGLRSAVSNLSLEHFERSENREILLAWQHNQGADEISKILDLSLHEHLEALMNRQLPPQDEGKLKQELADCIRRLEERRLRHQLVFEAALVGEGEMSAEGSMRLAELQRQRANSEWR